MPLLVNLLCFIALCYLLYRLRSRGWPLSRQILAGLVAGGLYGLALQFAWPGHAQLLTDTLQWTGIVASGYVSLLRMIIMPLVLVMMVAAVLKMRAVADLGKIGGAVVGLLIATTMIAAVVGILVTSAFGLSADSITQGAREFASAEALAQRYETVAGLGLPDMLVRFVPANVFYDLTEARPTSIIAVVIFGILFGIAALQVARTDPERGAQIEGFVDTTRLIVMRLVHIVMALTPYGILALIGGVVARSDAADIVNLLAFIAASYLGVHGVGLRHYFQSVWPVLAFAFTSRSSAASIPLNVETQVEKLRVATPIANLSATLGATIGQNGCAGIYPAMLAVMIAPSMGIDPLAWDFMAGLVGVIAISSFGVAGVGGGATFAALIVLPAMGFPVTVAAVLISIEPLIDMARTALNVNGAMTAGVVTQRWLGASVARD